MGVSSDRCIILCYSPSEDKWYKLREMPREYPQRREGFIFCRGKLHFVQHGSFRPFRYTCGFTVYDLYSNRLLSGLPDIDFGKVF